jgi:hypothetical protein
MSLLVKINGGYADKHIIPLNDMAKLSKAIQNISKNYEIKNEKTIYTDIYINTTKEGSFEIVLDLLQNNPYVQGIGAAYLYDLSKDIKSFILYTDKKKTIENLINDVYSLSIELADADYYDYNLEKKKQELEKKEKFLTAEFSTFNSIKDISSITKSSNDEQSNKPNSISFAIKNDNNYEEFEFNIDNKHKIKQMEYERINLDDVIVKGIPNNISREPNNYFKMKTPFFGTLKIYTNNEEINIIADYFKNKLPISIKINPIVKMGELINTKEAKLIEILKQENE